MVKNLFVTFVFGFAVGLCGAGAYDEAFLRLKAKVTQDQIKSEQENEAKAKGEAFERWLSYLPFEEPYRWPKVAPADPLMDEWVMNVYYWGLKQVTLWAPASVTPHGFLYDPTTSTTRDFLLSTSGTVSVTACAPFTPQVTSATSSGSASQVYFSKVVPVPYQ